MNRCPSRSQLSRGPVADGGTMTRYDAGLQRTRSVRTAVGSCRLKFSVAVPVARHSKPNVKPKGPVLQPVLQPVLRRASPCECTSSPCLDRWTLRRCGSSSTMATWWSIAWSPSHSWPPIASSSGTTSVRRAATLALGPHLPRAEGSCRTSWSSGRTSVTSLRSPRSSNRQKDPSKVIKGGQSLTVDAPLDTIPVYSRQ
jgi:hypothetical protein